MSKEDIIRIISDCCNDIYFNYNGKPSGITSEVHNSIPKFQAWHGEQVKYYDDIKSVITDPFYSGCSILELLDKVNISIA